MVWVFLLLFEGYIFLTRLSVRIVASEKVAWRSFVQPTPSRYSNCREMGGKQSFPRAQVLVAGSEPGWR